MLLVSSSLGSTCLKNFTFRLLLVALNILANPISGGSHCIYYKSLLILSKKKCVHKNYLEFYVFPLPEIPSY